MIDAVNSVMNVAGDAAALRATADTKAAAASTTAPQQQAETALKKADVAPISPRLRADFLSGTIITEFVGDNGQITQQSPTTAALAYLRVGLDANGQHKVAPDHDPKANAVVA